MGVDWRRKLASRKFWALLAGLCVALLKAFGAMPETAASVEATLGALGLVAAYVLAEGAVDAAAAGKRGAHGQGERLDRQDRQDRHDQR